MQALQARPDAGLLQPVLTIFPGLPNLAAMPCRGVFSGLPGMVTLLWALYNCIGPYLLLHYTYLGRQDSLRVASSIGMHLALGLAVLAVALLVMFSPTSHDLAQVGLYSA